MKNALAYYVVKFRSRRIGFRPHWPEARGVQFFSRSSDVSRLRRRLGGDVSAANSRPLRRRDLLPAARGPPRSRCRRKWGPWRRAPPRRLGSCWASPGTNVLIFKYFRWKIWRFEIPLTLVFKHWLIFRRKLAKLAENGDHYVHQSSELILWISLGRNMQEKNSETRKCFGTTMVQKWAVKW
jgi:hypothetical protein